MTMARPEADVVIRDWAPTRVDARAPALALGNARRHQRIWSVLEGIVRQPEDAAVCSVLNISQGGALIYHQKPLEAVEGVALFLPLKDPGLELSARVVRQDCDDYGLQFLDIAAAEREALFHWVSAKISSERRQHLPRVQADGVALVIGNLETARGPLHSLGLGGVAVRLKRELKVGSIYELVLLLPNGKLELKARALPSRGGIWPLEFLQVLPEDSKILRAAIRAAWAPRS